MPNNVLNEIIFRNVNGETQESILQKILKDGFVDFNVLVPTPLNIWRGGVGKKEEAAFGKKNWHDWNRENWGTKWNAYGQKEGARITRTEDSVTVHFETAWSPPRRWLAALFNSTGLPFEHNWLDEGDRCAHAAKFYFDDEDMCWAEDETEDKEFNRRMKILLYGEYFTEEE